MIRVTVQGASETVELFKRMPQRLALAILQAMRDVAVDIQSRAKLNAPTFRGYLRLSIVQAVGVENNRFVGRVGSGLVYAPVVEEGRKTGWFPPVRELKAWARKKLGDEKYAFVVARAIKRRGFRAQPHMIPALEAAKPRVQLMFEARINEAIRAMGGTA